jgi:hypothetical protein
VVQRRRASGNADHRPPNTQKMEAVISAAARPLTTYPVTSKTAAETAGPTAARPMIAITLAVAEPGEPGWKGDSSRASGDPADPSRVTSCLYDLQLPEREAAETTSSASSAPVYRVSTLSAAPTYSSAARQQYQAATDR